MRTHMPFARDLYKFLDLLSDFKAHRTINADMLIVLLELFLSCRTYVAVLARVAFLRNLTYSARVSLAIALLWDLLAQQVECNVGPVTALYTLAKPLRFLLIDSLFLQSSVDFLHEICHAARRLGLLHLAMRANIIIADLSLRFGSLSQLPTLGQIQLKVSMTTGDVH